MAKQIPNYGTIECHINGKKDFIPITNKQISNDYIILTKTKTVLNKSVKNLNLVFKFPNGVTEIESILIENINGKFRFIGKDNRIIFTSLYNMDLLNHFKIKYTTEFKYSLVCFYLIIFSIAYFVFLWIVLLNKLKLDLDFNNILYLFIIVFLLTIINIINYSNSYSYKEFIMFFIISFISSTLFFIFNFIAEKNI